MICAGVSVSYIIGTVITWRALALSGNTLIKHANKKKERIQLLKQNAMVELETYLNWQIFVKELIRRG